jgi:hypothetical protein
MKMIIMAALVLCALVLAASAHQGDAKDPAGRARNLQGSTTLFKLPDLELAKRQLQDVLSLIRARYELTSPIGSNFWLSTANFDSDAWDILKYKFGIRMLQNNTGNDYLMIFGGSSVTAAHDNYYNQSYPAIFSKRMRPVMETLGINLVVHNIAQGANNCIPYQLCYESMGGLNPEFVGWEQSYNCGHDDGVFELAARIAGMSSRRGIVYYSASGAWSPAACPPSSDKVPFSSEIWTPETAGIAAWTPSALDLKLEKDKLDKFARAKSSTERFHRFAAGGQYKAVAPMGFNVWEANPNCKGRDKEDSKDITGCNGIDAAQGCKLRFMTKEAALYGSDNGKGANWHPTRGFHMLRGEAVVWAYALTMLDAVYAVQAALGTKGASPEGVRKDFQSKLDALQPPLPAPKKCQALHCDFKPKCFTNFKPHYEPSLELKKIIVGKTNWTYEPGESASLLSCPLSFSLCCPLCCVCFPFSFPNTTATPTHAQTEDYEEWSLHYGYLDAKPLWQAQGPKGSIHVSVSVSAAASKAPTSVWLCGHGKEGLKHTDIFLDKDVKLPANASDYMPSPKAELWTKKSPVGAECVSVNELPPGSHVLSIDTAKAPEKHVHELSHVITW